MIFQTHIKNRYLELFLQNCPQVNATRPHRWLVNIGSDNGLVLSGNKPLPEPMLTQIYGTIWHSTKLSRAMRTSWVGRFLNNEIYCYPLSKKRCGSPLRSPRITWLEGIVTSGQQQHNGITRPQWVFKDFLTWPVIGWQHSRQPIRSWVRIFLLTNRDFNSLIPGRFKVYFRWVIYKLIFVVNGWGISCETALIWMSLDHIYGKSTLVQVMASCHQATSHYLSQWSQTPYGVTRPQ